MPAPTPPQLRPTMTTSKLVILILITASGLVSVHGKRHEPRHDEIERVTNVTHSDIWKCTNSECPPGSGLSVQCGTSISIDIPIKCVPCVKGVNYSNTHDYSTCKSCRNCTKNENTTGKCTPGEDTTECLGTCFKGNYMDNNTRKCHPCSDCCNNEKIYHEEQCKDSGLPPNQQCRKSNITCLHSTKSTISQLPNTGNPDNEQGSQEALAIALIIIFAIFFSVLLIVFLLRCYGWQKVRSFIRKWCCGCCRHGVPAEGIDSVNFDVSDPFFKGDSKAAVGSVCSGSHLTEGSDVLTNPSSLSENHDKNCDIKPASSGAVPGNGLLSSGSMVKALGEEGLEKEFATKVTVTDQCTSTTELYLSSTNKVSDIPQGFLNWFLSKRMSTIPIKFKSEICMKLDTTRELLWDDYRALAEEIGLGQDVILWLGQQKNRTELILQKFDAQKDPSIRRFKAILEKMERADLVAVIEDWALYEWEKQNNNSSSFL